MSESIEPIIRDRDRLRELLVEVETVFSNLETESDWQLPSALAFLRDQTHPEAAL